MVRRATHDYLMGEATSITLLNYRNKLVSEFAPICRNRYAIIIKQEFPSRNTSSFFFQFFRSIENYIFLLRSWFPDTFYRLFFKSKKAIKKRYLKNRDNGLLYLALKISWLIKKEILLLFRLKILLKWKCL